jgi:hypothetical protein
VLDIIDDDIVDIVDRHFPTITTRVYSCWEMGVNPVNPVTKCLWVGKLIWKEHKP